MKYFVTGGAGFLGSALTWLLSGLGHEVVVFDNLERGQAKYLPLDRQVSLLRGDIRDGAALESALAESRPDHVVHLAALHFIPDCIARPDDTREINVEGTRLLLSACSAVRPQSVIFASSAAVYAAGDVPCSEAVTPLGPSEVYGESKVQGEELVREFHARTRSNVTILRIFNAIGPRETNPHVVPHVFESLRVSDRIALGNVTPERDYVHTSDIAAAVLAVSQRSSGCETYNVGFGRAHSVAEIVRILGEKLRRTLHVDVDPKRLRNVDRPILLADITKIGERVGWAPRYSLDAALEELIGHYHLRVEPEPVSSRKGARLI
jgi:UDP-glucose 4-epimerase